MKSTLSALRAIRIPAAAGFYTLLSLLILGPLLAPGFILTLDMVFTPAIRMPQDISNAAALRVIMHTLDLLLPADVVQKLLLFSIFLLAGLGAHRLARYLFQKDASGIIALAPYFAGTLYLVNSFAYGRFIAGQYLVLFGYALLPWFARSLLVFARQPGWRTAIITAAWAVAISLVSIHTIGIAALFAALVLVGQLWRWRRDAKRQWRLTRFTGAVAALWFVASSYWLVPALLGRSSQAELLGSFTAGDRAAFATVGDSVVERIANVLSLQGFWGEGRGLFILPQYVTPQWLWLALTLLVLGLVVAGAVSWWRNGRRGEVGVFAGSIVIGAVLAAGIGGSWMAEHVPFYAGYREPHKFAALVALGYAVFAAAGFVALVRRLEHSRRFNGWAAAVAGLLLAVPFIWTPTMAWGANGQLQASQYPIGWASVNEILNGDPDEFKTVFLPWHMYMHMDFANRLIANPARQYFDRPVIISDDPELEGAALDRPTEAQRRIAATLPVAGRSDRRLGEVLAELDVKYVILAKDNDYEEYDYLARQSNLVRIFDDEAITLYRNTSYRQ